MIQTNGPAGASREELLRQAYLDAANDPAYQAEMADIDHAFDVIVADGLSEADQVGDRLPGGG